MPINETPNTVTVGQICYSCILFASEACPYGNHKKTSSLEFKGDIRGKCSLFQEIVEAKSKKMIKSAQQMTDDELNISLYRKIMAMSNKEKGKFIGYWDKLFPTEYAEEMGDESNKSKQKGLNKGKDTEDLEKKEDKWNSQKKEDAHNTKKMKDWYKNPQKKENDNGKRKDQFPDTFKS